MGTINRLRWTALAFGYILPTTGRIPNMHVRNATGTVITLCLKYILYLINNHLNYIGISSRRGIISILVTDDSTHFKIIGIIFL